MFLTRWLSSCSNRRCCAARLVSSSLARCCAATTAFASVKLDFNAGIACSRPKAAAASMEASIGRAISRAKKPCSGERKRKREPGKPAPEPNALAKRRFGHTHGNARRHEPAGRLRDSPQHDITIEARGPADPIAVAFRVFGKARMRLATKSPVVSRASQHGTVTVNE